MNFAGAVATTQNAEMEAARPSNTGEEDLQLQLALAMSKEEHEAEEKRRKGDDLKLQIAIEESKKLAEKSAPNNVSDFFYEKSQMSWMQP